MLLQVGLQGSYDSKKNYVRAESSGTCLFRMHNTGTIVLYHDLLGTFASFRKLGG
jgi:hypothetical protein